MMAARLRWFSAAVGEHPPPPRALLREFRDFQCLPWYRSSLKTWAIHEAAHVVTSTVLGWPVESAEIHSDGSGGFTRKDPALLDGPPSDRSKEKDVRPVRPELQGISEALAIICVAGNMGECLYLGIPITGTLGIGTDDPGHDYEKARSFLLTSYGHTAGIFWAQEMAKHILSINWPFVLAIADGLLVNGRLRKPEIAALAYRHAGIGRDPKLIEGGCYERADA